MLNEQYTGFRHPSIHLPFFNSFFLSTTFCRIPTSHEKRRPTSGGLRPVVINNALKYVPESKFNFRNKFEDSVLISR